jgi:hypothetical protein
MRITEGAVGLTTRVPIEGHLAVLATAPSLSMHLGKRKGPLLLGGLCVAPSDGRKWPWVRVLAIGAVSTLALTRFPSSICPVARV